MLTAAFVSPPFPLLAKSRSCKRLWRPWPMRFRRSAASKMHSNAFSGTTYLKYLIVNLCLLRELQLLLGRGSRSSCLLRRCCTILRLIPSTLTMGLWSVLRGPSSRWVHAALLLVLSVCPLFCDSFVHDASCSSLSVISGKLCEGRGRGGL